MTVTGWRRGTRHRTKHTFACFIAAANKSVGIPNQQPQGALVESSRLVFSAFQLEVLILAFDQRSQYSSGSERNSYGASDPVNMNDV